MLRPITVHCFHALSVILDLLLLLWLLDYILFILQLDVADTLGTYMVATVSVAFLSISMEIYFKVNTTDGKSKKQKKIVFQRCWYFSLQSSQNLGRFFRKPPTEKVDSVKHLTPTSDKYLYNKN